MWEATTAQACRGSSKVANLFFLLAHGSKPKEAEAELIKRLHPPLLRGERPTRDTIAEARQRALAAVVEAWNAAEQSISAIRLSGTPEACPYRWIGPAPAGWEAANQRALESDVRVALDAFWPALSGKVGPWEARDAVAAENKAGTARKRQLSKRALIDLKTEARSAANESEERRDAEQAVAAIIDSLPKAAPIRRALEAMLEEVDGLTITEAAKRAGISRKTLYKHLARLRSKGHPE